MVSKLSFIFKCLKPFYIIKSVDKTKLCYYTPPPMQQHSFFRELPPFGRVSPIQCSSFGRPSGSSMDWELVFCPSLLPNKFCFHLLPHFLTIPEHFIVILIATNMHVNQNETEGTGVEASVDVSQFCFV